MRGLVLMLLGGCTFLNAPDESRIRRVEICDNGIDDEGDEHADCNDPDCLSEFDCLVDMPLDREAQCEPLLPSFTLNDSFEQIELNAARWEELNVARIHREGLELFSGGVRSQDSVSIGASIPFELTLEGSILDRVRKEGEGCGFSLAFDAEERTDLQLLEVRASYLRRGGNTRFAPAEIAVECVYRDVPLEPIEGVVLVRAAHRPFQLVLFREEKTRDLVVELDEVEVCRTPLAELEVPARLRLSSENQALTQCGLRVESVDLIARAQEPSFACDGLRRPLIPDDQCVAGPLSNVRPWEGRVVRTRDRWEMLISGDTPLPFGGLTTRLMFSASSSDGRRDWILGQEPLFTASFDLVRMGALFYDEPRERLMLWFTDSGPPIYRDEDMDGMDDDWELANGLDPTRDDSNEDINGDQIPNGIEFQRGLAERGRLLIGSEGGFSVAPELMRVDLDPATGVVRTPLAVAPHARGMIGWFAALASGSDAIYAGFSLDGKNWELEDVPVLSSTARQQWDGLGVRAPAIVFTGDFYLMAYASTEFGGRSAIGLALSKDGIEWTRQANNPVVTGDDVGFDDEGVEPRSIELDGDVIRIWYFSRTNAPSPCLRPRNDYKQIGLTELRGRAR